MKSLCFKRGDLVAISNEWRGVIRLRSHSMYDTSVSYFPLHSDFFKSGLVVEARTSRAHDVVYSGQDRRDPDKMGPTDVCVIDADTCRVGWIWADMLDVVC